MAAPVCRHGWVGGLTAFPSSQHFTGCDLSSESRGIGGAAQAVRPAAPTPHFSHPCTRWLFQWALNKDLRAQSLWEACGRVPFPPLGPGVPFQCLSTASSWGNLWGQDGSLEHDLWWCSWRIFLVLTKPCEIVASYLCSFFLKWNAQWWCQWLNNHILWLRVQVSLQNKCKC